MSWIFTAMIGVSILCALWSGRGSQLSAAVIEGAQDGAALGLSLAGSVCLWTGVGRLLQHGGVTGKISRLLSPVLHRIFPSSKSSPSLSQALSGNICANLLGLGNAATPMGIQAARLMKHPDRPDLATDELCRLIVLNTASIQLIPGNVAAIRAGLGAVSPFDILPAVWLTSVCSAGLGLLAAMILGKAVRNA